MLSAAFYIFNTFHFLFLSRNVAVIFYKMFYTWFLNQLKMEHKMNKVKKEKIEAKGFQIEIYTEDFKNDYISLTDIARYKNSEEPKDVVKNWMKNKETIIFLGVWEKLNNPNFKGVEFDSFKNEAGTNAFTLSPKRWIQQTNAIGIISKAGRYGGTYAHSDIALEFASWVS